MKNIRDKIVRISDYVTIIIAISICIAAYIIDGYNDLTNNKSQIDYAYVSTTLLLAIAIHFILSSFLQNEISKQNEKLTEKIEFSTSTIINSLNGVEVLFFDNINDVDIYIAKKISLAQKCVYDFNWQDYTPINPYHRNPSDKEYASNKIDSSIKSFCSKKGAKPHIYREIFTFSYFRNVDKMLDHISYGNSYCCAYYDNLEQAHKFPKLQFVVIDDEEVVFVSSAYNPNLCAIKNYRIASIFCNYFEQAWELGTVIKDKNVLNESIIEDIKQKY